MTQRQVTALRPKRSSEPALRGTVPRDLPWIRRYFFSIECTAGQVHSEAMGEVPGGHRVHLHYSGGQVETIHDLYAGDPPPLWEGLEGSLASGADWAIVARDGIANFDGRVTLRANDGFVIEAVLRSTVDLLPASGRNDGDASASGAHAYRRWVEGDLDRYLPFAASIRFVGTSKPAPPDAAAVFKASAKAAHKYSRLFRGEFVALGYMELARAPYCPIIGLRLDVYEVVGQTPPDGGEGT